MITDTLEAENRMTKATWNVDRQTGEWQGATVSQPTLDEAVEQYYNWGRQSDVLLAMLRADALEYIRDTYADEAAERYPELMV